MRNNRNNKTCKEELKGRISNLKQTLRSHEYEDEIDGIIYYSLEIMEKILENTHKEL